MDTPPHTWRSKRQQPLGKRAQQTRIEILEALGELLEKTPWRLINVIDISRALGKAPATFYMYFADIEEAFDVMVAGLRERDVPLSPHIEKIIELRAWERANLPDGEQSA